MHRYLLNCFLLLLPVMLWDALFTDRLPAAFQPDVFGRDIPLWLSYCEQVSRVLLFLIAFLLPLPLKKLHQQLGFWLYLAGLAMYFASWIAQIQYPDSHWSLSLWGYLASAFTPLIWLSGIALTARRFYFRLPYHSGWFIALAMIFVCFHCWHTWLVWGRV